MLFAALLSPSAPSYATSVAKDGNPAPFLVAYELLAASLSQWAVMDTRAIGTPRYYAPVMASSGAVLTGYSLVSSEADSTPILIIGLGYLVIAEYNHRYADMHSENEIFRNNMIGYNLILATAVIWHSIFGDSPQNPEHRLALYATPSGILFSYRF